jgi:hypothetical protein
VGQQGRMIAAGLFDEEGHSRTLPERLFRQYLRLL